MILAFIKVINQFFPDLFERIKIIPDFRKKSHYDIVEVIFAGITLFLFKEGSRNAMNNDREALRFKKNYKRAFKLRLPHMDTVEEVLRILPESYLEELKKQMIQLLFEKKFFNTSRRLFNEYIIVAVDGCHVMNVNEGHCEHCLYKEFKSGKIVYFHQVLEAKIVTPDGFAISIATEWIENPVGEYDKQDCEQKAFLRLAEKIKREYPRLKICIAADGLYPNITFFKTCLKNDWEWIVTFKDGNLKSVWEEVESLLDMYKKNNTNEIRVTTSYEHGKPVVQAYQWVNSIDYKGITLNWLECIEEKKEKKTHFVHLTSFEVTYHNVQELSLSGRLRWKIENEGFNIQKNHGYGLGHKYSRVSFLATKNWYQLLQIGHLINQLVELSSCVKALLIGKQTIKNLWKRLIGFLSENLIDRLEIDDIYNTKYQIRFG